MADYARRANEEVQGKDPTSLVFTAGGSHLSLSGCAPNRRVTTFVRAESAYLGPLADGNNDADHICSSVNGRPPEPTSSRPAPLFNGMVEHDGHVGVLLDKIDQLGIADNTIVMYATDNGAEEMSWPDGGTTPFRGEKDTNWEGGWRVPCLIRWPGVLKPGTVSNEIHSHQDMLPTLVAAAGDLDVIDKLKKGVARPWWRSRRGSIPTPTRSATCSRSWRRRGRRWRRARPV